MKNIEMSEINFTRDVIERSQVVPVVVDFWAEWCGPCRVLGPVIEGLAAEANGKWELVKINTEIHQDIAMQFQIRSIPAVKMFYQGEIIAEFMGALPRFQIERWLEQHIPDPNKGDLKLLLANWEEQKPAQLAARLQSFSNKHPNIPEAQLWLAMAMLVTHPQDARQLLDQVSLGSDVSLTEPKEDISNLTELMETDPGENQILAPSISEAQTALKAWDWEGTLQALIQAVMLNKDFANELPRRATVAIFRLLGHSHELSKKYRRKFDMALY